MATQSPFPFLDTFFERLRGGLQPPPWMIEEIQRRMVLLLNHVLMQEPEAQARLARQAQRVAEARWRNFTMRLVATPAGLLDLAPGGGQPDLTLTLTEESPWGLAQAALRGDNPPVRIEGDVQFAAEINWLVDNVRWDMEEDLSRLIGDAPANAMSAAARRIVQALRQFVRPPPAGQAPSPRSGQAGPPSTGSGQAASTGSGQAPSTSTGPAASTSSGQA
jgi:ubiquinone biosynthesis accessory factor UbiJ